LGVSCDNLTVEYRTGGSTVRPIDALSVEVADGELALLLGASGSGKTTLLSVFAAILRPAAGTVHVAGVEVTGLKGRALAEYRRGKVGIVFQALNLIPSLSASENVQVPLRAAGLSAREAEGRADRLLSDLGLAGRRHHRPGDLSGGQQQRVAIARALALDPPVLLADEPTAHLDYLQVEGLVNILRRIADDGRTVVVSTHDERLTPIADRVLDMVPAGSDAVSLARKVTLATGEVLFHKGDPGDLVYLIEDGEIEIVRESEGRTSDTVVRLGPGDYFGELAPMLRLPRSATARATAPTHLLGLSGSEFRQRARGESFSELLAARPELG
jgi:putative ABC transport system ATP-binding protein